MSRFAQLDKDAIRNSVEIGAGVIIGVLFAKLSNVKTFAEAVEPITIGLLTTIACGFIFEIGDLRRSMRSLFNRIEIDFAGLAGQHSRYPLALKYANKHLTQNDMRSTWEELLWKMDSNLDAVSYVKPSEFADAYPQRGFDIQKLKIQIDKTPVRRIFVLDNLEELAILQPHIAVQKSARIEVSYILLDQVKNGIDLADYKTLDFGLFDHGAANLAFLWFLDNRKVVGGILELRQPQYEHYRTFFDKLCRLSQPFPY